VRFSPGVAQLSKLTIGSGCEITQLGRKLLEMARKTLKIFRTGIYLWWHRFGYLIFSLVREGTVGKRSSNREIHEDIYCTPSVKAIEELSERIAEQIKRIVQRIGQESREEKRTLEWFEKQAVMILKGVGQTLVTGLCELYASAYPPAEISCQCGGVAVNQRWRAGQTKTLLGEIAVTRAYYCVQRAGRGTILDAMLGFVQVA
jgi:hypothetical protein